MTNTQELVLEDFEYSIKRLGYYKIDNCIKDKNLLSALSRDLDAAIAEDSKEQDQGYRFYDIVHQLFGRGESFLDLMMDPVLNECAEKILSPTCIIHSYNAVKLMPSRGNNATKVHRDCPRFYGQDYPLALQALICLDPFTLENGATHMLPASHHIPERPSDEYFYKNSTRMVGNPGDVIFFDSLVWHAGGENMTQQPRRGLTIVYTRAFMKQQIDLPRAIPADYIAKMPEKARQKIGMDVRVPANMDEFSMPEEKRFYKSNQG